LLPQTHLIAHVTLEAEAQRHHRIANAVTKGLEQHVKEYRKKGLVQLVMTQHQTPSDNGNTPICCYGDAISVFTNIKLTAVL